MIFCPAQPLRRSKSKTERTSAAHHGKRAYDDFVLLIPLIRDHARFSFRKKRPEEKAELVEECLANAFRTFARLQELGKEDLIYPTVLAKFAVKQVRDGRRVGTPLNSNDVLSRYAQLRKNIKIQSLEYYDHEEEAWREAVIEDQATPVPEQVAFRVDFPAWLERYQRPQRRIAAALALGYTTTEAAKSFKVSAGRISQLRRDFERSWEAYQGEEKSREAVLVVA
jgi:hypothetical protein